MTCVLEINLSLIINTGITLKMADIIDVNLIILFTHSNSAQRSGLKIFMVKCSLMCFGRYKGHVFRRI